MTLPQPRLLIATRNPGKMREFRQLLAGVPFSLVSLDDLGITLEVEETGASFEENARLKALSYTQAAGPGWSGLTLADDSGLEVDALGGEPGIHSARYGGDASFTDQDRVALLLRRLEGVPWERRTARFRSVIAIAIPQAFHAQWEIPPTPLYKGGRDGSPLSQRGARGDFGRRSRGDLVTVVGSVAGMIQYEPAGDEGFGYDPVFYLPSYGLTMAQLPLEEKNRISHRADAARKAVAVLKALAGAGGHT